MRYLDEHLWISITTLHEHGHLYQYIAIICIYMYIWYIAKGVRLHTDILRSEWRIITIFFLFQMGPEYCSILRKALPTIILQLEIDEVFLSLFRPHDIFEDGTFDDISVSENERNSKVWLHMYENCHHQFDKQRIRRTIFTNKATRYRYHSEVWWCAFALINWVTKGLLPHT